MQPTDKDLKEFKAVWRECRPGQLLARAKLVELAGRVLHGKKFINNVTIGDCLEVLKLIPDNSIDSVVTDPPAGIGFMNKEWDSDKGGRDKWIEWLARILCECNRVLKPGGHALVWALPRTSHWTAFALENAGFEIRDIQHHLFGTGFPKSLNISKAIDRKQEVKHPKNTPISESAKQWQGWGTALKPAVEHWLLARKPLSEKTIAENVLKWDVGGLNIDACRVETDEVISAEYGQRSGTGRYSWNLKKKKIEKQGLWNTKGRFPANLIHDGSPIVLAELPKARFFYCAKASKAERDLGLENMEAKAGIRTNAPRENEAARTKPTKNNHPTVKAQALMQYLIKLITPPNGIVLDCFAGSGSTLVAAKTLGHPFIGIEKFQGYVDIAKARLNNNH
ncbi:MAG: site-specific DNA-methyltransferase [Candidatus Doudnabacteria bacterium]|nr:site-specific DNA-methyltransferase [Candidatus Doudnabacteria bacterium]